MKRIVIFSLSLALTVLGMNSCAKSNKRKMANEWQVTSFEQTTTGTTSTNVHTEKIMMNEATFTRDLVHTEDGTVVASYSNPGTVNVHTLTIKKDGTWSWVKDLSYDGAGTVILEQSGTWSFIGKTKGDEFKKNERVLFNILSEKNTTIYQSNQGSSQETYLTGDKTLIYTVTESKSKELTLELDATTVGTNGGSTNTDKISQKIILKEK